MKIKDLVTLYNSNRNECCKCGCTLETNGDALGECFVLDKLGNFYCTECDHIFDDPDDMIFDPELYDEEQMEDECDDY